MPDDTTPVRNIFDVVEQPNDSADNETDALLRQLLDADEIALEEGLDSLKEQTGNTKKALQARLDALRRDAAVEQAQRGEADRRGVDVSDPNRFHTQADELEAEIGDRLLAFSFGELPVVIRKMRSASLTVIRRDDAGNAVTDKTGKVIRDEAELARPVVIDIGRARRLCLEVATFFKPGRRGVVSVETPASLIQILKSSLGPRLPVLKGVAAHPVWQAGGLVSGDGIYDPETRLWLQCSIPRPSRQFATADEAYRFLRDDWLGDFPFQSEADAAGAITMAATGLVAKTVCADDPGPPLFLFTSPFAGTGKTLLATALGTTILGETLPSVTYPENEEEREKVISSVLLEGSSFLLFDNLRTASTIGNSHQKLIKLVTDTQYRGRILGETKTFNVAANIVVAGTGNNIVLAGDMASRVLEIRLVPDDSVNLVKRVFKHANIVRWTKENRADILHALDVILRQDVSGLPLPSTRFSGWAKAAALPVMKVSGSLDLLDPFLEAAEEDQDGHATQNLFGLLNAIARLPVPDAPRGTAQPDEGTQFTAGEILDAVDESIVSAAHYGDRVASPEGLVKHLKRNDRVRVNDLRLYCEKENLGARTGYKRRHVFRVSRPAGKRLRSREEVIQLARAQKTD